MQVTRHTTRMLTADSDGDHIFVLNPVRMTSHFSWRDATHLIAFAYNHADGNRFYLFEHLTDRLEVLGQDVMTSDGHCSYLTGGRWILNDMYPDKQRNQTPYLFDTQPGKRYVLGHFYQAPKYWEDKPFVSWRCDLHPRSSPDSRKVIIDSPHNNGRQMYLIDIFGDCGIWLGPGSKPWGDKPGHSEAKPRHFRTRHCGRDLPEAPAGPHRRATRQEGTEGRSVVRHWRDLRGARRRSRVSFDEQIKARIAESEAIPSGEPESGLRYCQRLCE